jgi:fumarylacetoacetate (FAA) hydrolase family protein
MTPQAEMRELLLGILEAAFSPGDVTATQQMGVQMTNSVKKDGVVIIQNQNVEVYARIMPSMVKAIRLCDSIIEPKYTVDAIEHAPIQIEHKPVDPIEECCRHMYDEKMDWKEMQELIKVRYLEYVISQHETKTAAAKWLGVGPTYLCKMTTKKPEGKGEDPTI